MSTDWWPLFRQWNWPFGQAEVPGSSLPSAQSQFAHAHIGFLVIVLILLALFVGFNIFITGQFSLFWKNVKRITIWQATVLNI